MTVERTEASSRITVYSCDVPRCLERTGSIHSPELWAAGIPAPEGLPNGWVQFALSDADRKTIQRMVLCPDHAYLAQHRELLELAMVVAGVEASVSADPNADISNKAFGI
jgi:hypothetical protein